MNTFRIAARAALVVALATQIAGCAAAQVKSSAEGGGSTVVDECVRQSRDSFDVASACFDRERGVQDDRFAAAERRFLEVATPTERDAYRRDLDSWIARLDEICLVTTGAPTDAQRLDRLHCRVVEISQRADLVEGLAADRHDRRRIATVRASYLTCLDHAEGEAPSLQRCIEEESGYQQQRLANAERKLVAQISSSELSEYRHQSAAWKAAMAAACMWDAETEGQGQRIAANDCALNRLAERAADAERRIR